MLSFIGKVFLTVAALLGVRTAAGSRGRARGHGGSSDHSTHPLLADAEPVGAVPETGGGGPTAAATSTDSSGEAAGRSRQGSEQDRAEETARDVNDADRVPGAIEAARRQGAWSPAVERTEPAADDPLAAKHRSPSFDRDFRTVNYGNLSKEDAAEARRRQRERESSTWMPPQDDAKVSPGPATRAQFAQFGGSVVSADVMRGDEIIGAPDRPAAPAGETGETGEGGAAAGNPAGPARPGKLPLAAPDPDGPTPSGEERQRAGVDPLADKHRAAPFDSDFRTLDYGDLDAPEAGQADVPDAPGAAALGREDLRSHAPADADVPAAFQAGGVGGLLHPAPGAERGDGSLAARDVAGEEVFEPPRQDEPDEGGPDDLTSIRGIGPTLERILFENGVYHFRQIAAWNEKEVRWINRTIGFRGRVEREHWIEQARALAKPARPPRPAGAGTKPPVRE